VIDPLDIFEPFGKGIAHKTIDAHIRTGNQLLNQIDGRWVMPSILVQYFFRFACLRTLEDAVYGQVDVVENLFDLRDSVGIAAGAGARECLLLL